VVLADMSDELVPVIAIAGGICVAMCGILCGTLKSLRKNAAREETRREIAAYIAEGTITADEGERLLKAGPDDDSCWT